MNTIIYIAIGGAGGAILRYLLGTLVSRSFSPIFPYGTLFVNLLGSFVLGFLWYFSERTMLSPAIRAMLFVGFLGAFTTFSTYSLETVNLLRTHETKLALMNILLNNIGGIFLLVLGLICAQLIVKFWQ